MTISKITEKNTSSVAILKHSQISIHILLKNRFTTIHIDSLRGDSSNPNLRGD